MITINSNIAVTKLLFENLNNFKSLISEMKSKIFLSKDTIHNYDLLERFIHDLKLILENSPTISIKTNQSILTLNKKIAGVIHFALSYNFWIDKNSLSEELLIIKNQLKNEIYEVK